MFWLTAEWTRAHSDLLILVKTHSPLKSLAGSYRYFYLAKGGTCNKDQPCVFLSVDGGSKARFWLILWPLSFSVVLLSWRCLALSGLCLLYAWYLLILRSTNDMFLSCSFFFKVVPLSVLKETEEFFTYLTESNEK